MPTLAPSPRRRTIRNETAIELLDGEIRRIAELIADTSPAAPIPGCDRDLADLTEHVALVHKWAATIVESLTPRRIEQRSIEVQVPADWSAVPAWFSRNGAELVAVLRAADPDAPVYSWGADQHVGFWIRRMLHETTIHRTDVEACTGVAGRIEPAVAVDAVDELLDILPFADFFRPNVRDLHGDGETIHLHATDLDGTDLRGEWLITLEPEGFRYSHAHVKGAAAVRGTAQDLALFAYGRRKVGDPQLDVIGDLSLLAHWSSKSAI
ncbi:maleylpyruvate isomerase family mycothiol-dependent enzyme [Actinocrinis puniceicyclus]|uniref:Maleylpyruvate isomerase family mycothiol-dependent enzyme n=1 Tax=Actinocrinis puniceicyclus TaxID=977794 RepID=A0A8J7WPY9_9ACTN|nr:maleylpyruvate isomerase family mycothiol-dependent enzyme [Actinocrinis puniceicyclus]MBS2963869.1 maleylpyruvate isomerase family mycothiol-dependent enzyme [Actinocrinis puniceicyclus]